MSASQDPADSPPRRSLPRRIVDRGRHLLRQLGFRPSARRYWASRAHEHGIRSVLDLRHTDADVATVTAAQADLLFPLLRVCLKPDDRRLLDFGCGPGRFTPELARIIGGTAVGIDPVEHYLRLAPKSPMVEYRRLEGRRIDAPDSSFDVVWVCLVLGGIVSARELKHTAHEINRVLKPGGLLFMVENTTEKRDGMYWKFRSADAYRRLFPLIDLEEISQYVDLAERMTVLAGRKR